MFSESPCLPGFLFRNWPPSSGSDVLGSGPVARRRASRPPTGAFAPKRVSGLVFHSILIDSAPSATQKRVPPAEARNHVKSRIRTPARAKGFPYRDVGSDV